MAEVHKPIRINWRRYTTRRVILVTSLSLVGYALDYYAHIWLAGWQRWRTPHRGGAWSLPARSRGVKVWPGETGPFEVGVAQSVRAANS